MIATSTPIPSENSRPAAAGGTLGPPAAPADGPPAWLVEHGDLLVYLGTIAACLALLIAADRLLKRRTAASGRSEFAHQLMMIGLTSVAIVVLVVTAPIGQDQRQGLVTLLGIAITAAIGLSSTTILSNAMAGLLLRSVGNFRAGDFVRVGEHMGRVTERGLFHTELQTEFRDLTTLPNFYLVSNPVTVVRSSGTVVYATVSLGYDVPEPTVRAALLRSAEAAGLSEGFVHVVELGDFSVVYRVAGFLSDVKMLLSARSELRRAMLHALHQDRIEIVSPSFMVQRPQAGGVKTMPPFVRTTDPSDAVLEAVPESIIFDKADRAEIMESLRHERESAAADLKAARAEPSDGDDESRHRRKDAIDRTERRIAVLDRLIERAGKRKDEDEA